MKNLIPLMVLASVISCGEKNSKGANPLARLYMDALSSQAPGMVIERRTLGEEYRLKQDPAQNYKWTAAKQNNNHLRREIVLKVDGDLIYTYAEDIDQDQTKDRSPTITILSKTEMMALLNEALKNTSYRIEGDYIVANNTGPAEDFYHDKYEYDGRVQASLTGGTVNSSFRAEQNNILCTSEDSEVLSGLVFTTEEGAVIVADVSEGTTSSCPTPLSREEMKKLDLTKITVCDIRKRNDEDSCKEQDMSYLVK